LTVPHSKIRHYVPYGGGALWDGLKSFTDL
jgi:hypothetical protein